MMLRVAAYRLHEANSHPASYVRHEFTYGADILVNGTNEKSGAAGVSPSQQRHMDDTPSQTMTVTPADRARHMEQTPFVVWMTGLSGAGKSTISDLLDRRLYALGHHTSVLDGDNLRRGINADLGFSDADRSENIRRVGQIAALMADAGLIALVSLISPFRADRDVARNAVGTARFLEIYIDAPLDVCASRDPKGMYARAKAGSLAQFTGIGSGYEPPLAPDLHLRTDLITPEEAVNLLLSALRGRGLIA